MESPRSYPFFVFRRSPHIMMSPTAAAQSERLKRAAGDNDCPICLDALSSRSCIRLAGCDHVLHLACYLNFTQHDHARDRASRCPLCRATLIVEQKTEGTGVFAVDEAPDIMPNLRGSLASPQVMAKCLLRWATERQQRGTRAEPVPVTHRAREELVRALELQNGLSPILSEGSRAWRHSAAHASLLAGPGADSAEALQATASELVLGHNVQQMDALGRDPARQRRERKLDQQALEDYADRQRKRKQEEKQDAERERKRLREQIKADRREQRP